MIIILIVLKPGGFYLKILQKKICGWKIQLLNLYEQIGSVQVEN
jgi:hypothetical protein